MAAYRPPPARWLLEAARLAAVRSYGVLGREDFESLDQLAGYVGSLFGQSMAAVSFVDEHRVWFGGGLGLAGREVARHDSFCDEAIRRPGPLVVRDAREDSRFCAHELVQGPAGVRSYVGVPIEDGDGYRLGAVCVFGRESGSPAADGVPELAGLARLTASFLDSLRSGGRKPEMGPARVQGWLGVRTLGSSRYGRGKQPGLIVLSVAAGSPAARAGLRPTDILYAIDEHVLRQPGDVVAALAGREAGELARVQFQRGGRWLECSVPVNLRASRMIRPRQA
jgi:hypothetical protein